MLEDYNYITEELPLDMFSLSKMYDDTWEEMQECVRSIRENYGLSFEEYANERNTLLRSNNGMLLSEDFQEFLLNRIIFDLVGRGYLELDPQSSINNFQFILTEKSFQIIDLITHNWIDGVHLERCPNDAFDAILFFRNIGVIDYLHDQAIKRQHSN